MILNRQDIARSNVHVRDCPQIGPEIIDRLLHMLVDLHERSTSIYGLSGGDQSQSIDRISAEHQADVLDGARSGVEQNARRDVDRVVLGAGLAVAKPTLEA